MDQKFIVIFAILLGFLILIPVWKLCSFLIGFFVSDGPKKQWATLAMFILIIVLVGVLVR